MNGTADNTYYTTHAWRKKQSQLRMAVNPGVLCTLNASNELSQHGVHDKQTAILLPHYITQTWLHVCKARLSSQTSKPSAISVGAHTSKQNTHTHHFLSSILGSWVLSSTLHTASQPNLCHTSHRGCCTSLNTENMSTNWRWASGQSGNAKQR